MLYIFVVMTQVSWIIQVGQILVRVKCTVLSWRAGAEFHPWFHILYLTLKYKLFLCTHSKVSRMKLGSFRN